MKRGLAIVIVLLLAITEQGKSATLAHQVQLTRSGTSHIVTSTANSGPGTLRQALLDAQPGDTITFDPTVFPPGMPVSITLTSPLPTLTRGFLTLDASDAGVILDGRTIDDDGSSGLTIPSNGNVVRGLQIIGFPGNGIELQSGAQNNTIGGDRNTGTGPLGQGNLLSGNRGRGVALVDPDTSFNTIVGNYIGTDVTGTAVWEGQMGGLDVNQATRNEVVGNLISGNDGNGVDLHDGASHNTIGPDNVIAHNGGNGIDIHDSTSLGNTITHNSIYSHTFATGIELWAGGNLERTAPLITEFDLVAGTVMGVTCAGCTVEIFSDSSDEAKFYEGQALADGAGAFSFDKGLLMGPHLTATATDVDGNTSELSKATSGVAGSRVLQQENTLPLTPLRLQQSGSLADNRMAAFYNGLWPPEDFSRQIIESGVKRVRLAINSLDADRVDWSQPEFYVDPIHDAVVTKLAAQDITLTYVLSFWDKATYPGGVGAPCPRFKTEEEIQHYLSFVQFIVQHFKDRIEYYEVWNEPDVQICPQWIEVADYTNLVERVVPVIRAEYPQAKIQVGGVSGLGNPDAQAYLFAILESGVMPLVDIVSWHPFYGESAEHNSTYYHTYPSLVQTIKDTASAHGFTGEYEADELTYQTPDDPTRPPEQWAYEEAICAKHYARGIVRHLGTDVIVGYGGTAPHRVLSYGTIQSLATTMAGVQPISLPLAIQTVATNVVSFTFSLPGDAYLVALWTDGIAVDSDPGVTATLHLGSGFSAYKAVAVDPLYGLQQELVTGVEDDSLVVHVLIVEDYPRLIRIFASRSIFLPIVLKEVAH